MGIINLTPDSFSDGGKYVSPDAARDRALQLVADGADVLDLGAESTRPGHSAVSVATELSRLIPALQAIRAALPDTPISVDTYKAAVAHAAIHAGADIINDIWGGLHDVAGTHSPICATAASLHAPIILTHNRHHPAPDATFWEEYLADLRHIIALARTAGIPDSQVWLDPGFGFGKTPPQNLECLRLLDRTRDLGFPILLGTSRKSTLGSILNAPVDARLAADIASNVWGISQGVSMIRVHDVAAVLPAVRTADAINAGIRWQTPS
jgi:dihydropteroate synthase